MAKIWLLFVVILLIGCEDLQNVLKNVDSLISDETEWVAPPGSEATQFLAATTKAFPQDSAAMIEAMDVGIKEKGAANLRAAGGVSLLEDTQEVSGEAGDVLEKTRSAKKNHKPDDFLEPEVSFFNKAGAVNLLEEDYSNDKVVWDSSLGDKYHIPVLDKMPVRNQGQRGTCAAFAGIGQIEGYILQNTTLSSVDLSEQRFYAMSKPEFWSNGGGGVNQGGSNSGDGFAKSYFKALEYGDETSPTVYNIQDTFNIPLETKCPYKTKAVDNDIQAPGTKEGGCATGVAQVMDFAGWMHQWENRLGSAQEIYDHLKTKKFPVIVFTKLSDNWESNDGIVTWADADGTGSTSHASGHAYLFVGMRKLSEAEYPGEGGMCFLAKNSWGKGWGINGLACVTLTWFNKHRFNNGFPTVFNINIDTETLQTDLNDSASTQTDELTEPDEGTKENNQSTVKGDTNKKSTRPRGTVSFAVNPNLGIPLQAADFTAGALLNNEDEFKRILYKVDGENIVIRGILGDGKTQTHNLELSIIANQIYADFEGKGQTQVGELFPDSKEIRMCSQKYAEKCHLNYIEESNELIVGISEAELLRDDSVGPYSWNYLGVADQGIEVSFPGDFSTKLDVRFNTNGKTTNPLRFRIKPVDGDILFQGQTIGDYQKGQLCSGDYKNFCRMVRTPEKFMILFRAKKG